MLLAREQKKEIRRYFITIYNFVQLGMYKCVPMCQISSLRDILASFVTFAIQNGVKLFLKEQSAHILTRYLTLSKGQLNSE